MWWRVVNHIDSFLNDPLIDFTRREIVEELI